MEDEIEETAEDVQLNKRYTGSTLLVDDLWGMKKRRTNKVINKGTSSRSYQHLPPETKDLFEKAQEKYISGDFEDAIEVLTSIVEKASKVPDVYELLGLIHEACDRHTEALQFYSIAISHAKRSYDVSNLYKKMAEIAYFLGFYKKVNDYEGSIRIISCLCYTFLMFVHFIISFRN